MAERVDLQELLVHADWVRRVAFELVGSAAAADDVVQATWVAALEHPPRERRNLRGWLRRVTRNQALQSWRKSSRRGEREREVARPEAQPSTDELVERAALQREVCGHVLALDEALREVVLLRFFEDQPPPAIAARLGLPLKTVHSRLARALEKLRARLDDEHGQRRSWCLALAPLAAGRGLPESALLSPATSSALGALLMHTNIKLGLAALLALAAGIGAWQHFDAAPSAAGGPVVIHEEPLTPDSQSRPSTVERQRRDERLEVAAAPSAEPATGSARAALTHVIGRAVDVSGNPLGNLHISVAGDARMSTRPQALTEADGRFAIDLPLSNHMLWNLTDSVCLEVLDPAWVTLRKSCVRQTTGELEHIIVAAPHRRLEGRVVDSYQVAIPDAKLALSYQARIYFELPYPLDLTSRVDFETRSDESGRFEFERFPDTPRTALHVSAAGYQSRTIELDEQVEPYVFELARSEDAGGRWLEGLVLERDGGPAADVEVKLGSASTRSAEDGTFRLQLGWVQASTPLVAARRGQLPALIPDFGARIEDADGQPEPVELRLGGEPLEIRGRVLDTAGEPCKRWTVTLVDPTAVSQMQIPVESAEDLARSSQRSVRTDKLGNFTLTGLYPREYVVQAYHEDTLQRTEGTLRAGDTAARLVASRQRLESLTGRVLSRSGLPLAGVRVSLSMYTLQTEFGSSSVSGDYIVTGADGRFEFDDVPAQHVHLSYSGEGILPGSREIEPAQGVGCDIEALRRCHFRVELPADSDIDGVYFEDADGRRLQINRFESNAMSAFETAPVVDGSSETLSVSELAALAIFERAGQALDRRPVSLDPEGVNSVSR